jgi:hypothetical protein
MFMVTDVLGNIVKIDTLCDNPNVVNVSENAVDNDNVFAGKAEKIREPNKNVEEVIDWHKVKGKMFRNCLSRRISGDLSDQDYLLKTTIDSLKNITNNLSTKVVIAAVELKESVRTRKTAIWMVSIDNTKVEVINKFLGSLSW